MSKDSELAGPGPRLQTQWLDDSLTYDGSQLRAHWILRHTGLRGDALVGFSTVPRAVTRRGAGGRVEEISLRHHVKTLLFVSRTGRDLPQPSAALSARIGLALEIVPLLDPLPLLPGHDLPMQVRFEGPGLAAAVCSDRLSL